MSEALPDQIGRFHVQSELGRGGFGRVYKAFDPTVSRLVAIKVLTEGGKDILTRFQNEATVAGNLRHENIVTVYEYGEHEGKPFLAMEFLEGADLQRIIQSKRPLSLLQKCQIMSQVAEGLHCAHRNGVIHRDVKPANIMVLADGHVKIMDFGIARVIRDAEATRLTQEGHMLGTLLYMAPEQFNGSATDALCDIFAYGAIFYELVAGRHPFAATDARVLMYKISFDEPPPLDRVNPDLPEGLQQIIARLLHKDRELRYQSLKEVQLDIGPILIELRQQQATELLGQARQSYESGAFDEAQSLVLEVLHLDSTEKSARALWEELQQQLRLRTLRPRVDALLEKGQQQLAQRLFEQALQSFEAARRLDPDNSAIQGHIQQASDEKRAAAIERIVTEAGALRGVQDFDRAQATLERAVVQYAADPALVRELEAVRAARAAWERTQAIDEAVRQATEWAGQHRYADAMRMIAWSLEKYGNDPALLEIQRTVEGDWEEHNRRDALAETAVTPRELIAAVQETRTEVRWVEQIEAQLEAGDTGKAAALLSLAEVECPGSSLLPDVRRRVDQAQRRPALTADPFVRESALNREPEQVRQTDPAATRPDAERAQCDRPIADAAIDQEAAAATPQSTTLQQERKAPAAGIGKRILLAGGLAAALVFGGIGLRMLRRPPTLIALRVTSSPSDATIQTGQQVCNSPGCVFKFQPGTYTIEARRDGYRPAAQQVTVDAARTEAVVLTLEPLHPQIQITTNFASGTVQLDGATAGELRDGQLTLSDLPFGKHRVAVKSPDGQGAVTFETSAGSLPAIRRKLEAEDADAIVVSNLGRQARLDCNCGNDRVMVDGKPAGELSANGLELKDLAEGTRTLHVGERVLVMSVRPEPVLNLFLTSSRNIGTLVIETNVENPTVVVGKKHYPGDASQGLIRVPLKAGEYAVSLQKNGYRSPAPQTVRIQKGGAEKLVMRLERMSAAFRLHGAGAGTQVSLDGKPAGVVAADERFSVEVAPGEHTIELTRHGYTPKRIVRRFEPGQTVEVTGAEAILSPDQNALEEARRKTEQAAWDTVNKNDRAALQQYLDQHSGGRFAQDAANLIHKMDQAEKRKRDEDQRKVLEAQRKAAQDEEQRKKKQRRPRHCGSSNWKRSSAPTPKSRRSSKY